MAEPKAPSLRAPISGRFTASPDVFIPAPAAHRAAPSPPDRRPHHPRRSFPPGPAPPALAPRRRRSSTHHQRCSRPATGAGGGLGARRATHSLRSAGRASPHQKAGEGPKVVPGPGYLPECFAPWAKDTKYFQWKARKPPFRIALVNGYVGNAWRIQMVKTAKAFAKDPAIAPLIKEFKVVSTGTDIAAQLGAIEDFINQGFDGIVTLAVSPEGFDRVIRLANKKGVVIVPFDNVLDTDKVMQVNEDQLAMGRQWGEFLDKQLGGKGKVLEVRGLQGNSVGSRSPHRLPPGHGGPGKKYEIVEVVGSWDDGKAQKAVADALAVHRKFDALFVQGGSTGAIRALLDAGHKPIPVATEAENGARKLIAQYHDKGMKGLSLGQSPGLAAIAMKAALEGLQGKVLPQKISVPIPAADHTTLKDGENYLLEAVGQLLHAQRVSALRREHLGRQDHERVGNRREVALTTTELRRPAFQLRNVSKHYGGVVALNRVNFACEAGKIHAILGENGAGKSTLIKIISGVVQPNEGELLLEGKRMTFLHPVEANAAGVVCVFQELSLLPTLSVAENIGITMPTNRLGLFDGKAQTGWRKSSWPASVAKTSTPRAWVNSLPLSRRQMVEIAKALGRNPRLLDSGRGHVRLDQRRRRKGRPHPGPAPGRWAGDTLHLAPHARDQGAGGRDVRLPQRPARRDVSQEPAHRRRDRAAHDRARSRTGVPAQA